MIITGMAEYESVCKNALVEWYNAHTTYYIRRIKQNAGYNFQPGRNQKNHRKAKE